jgi:hypothetical protein
MENILVSYAVSIRFFCETLLSESRYTSQQNAKRDLSETALYTILVNHMRIQSSRQLNVVTTDAFAMYNSSSSIKPCNLALIVRHPRLTVSWLVSSCIVAESKGLGGLTRTPGSSSSDMTSSSAFRLSKMIVEASARSPSVPETALPARSRCMKGSSIMARALSVVSVAEGLSRRRVGVGGTEMMRSASSSVASSEEPAELLRRRPAGSAEPESSLLEGTLKPSSVSESDSMPGSASSSLHVGGWSCIEKILCRTYGEALSHQYISIPQTISPSLTLCILAQKSCQSSSSWMRNPRSILGSRLDIGIFRTRSQWNVCSCSEV